MANPVYMYSNTKEPTKKDKSNLLFQSATSIHNIHDIALQATDSILFSRLSSVYTEYTCGMNY